MSQKITQRQATILQKLEYGKEYSISSFMDMSTDISLATLKRDISELKEYGFLGSKGEKRGVVYFLTPFGVLYNPIVPADFLVEDGLLRKKEYSFNFSIFDFFSEVNIFTKEEFETLNSFTTIFHKKIKDASDVIVQKELQRFVIELSWKSSRIEGNTYTLLDTEKLLIDGIPAEGKTKEETQMILNHKNAFTYVLDLKEKNSSISVAEIQNLHQILMQDLGVSSDIRKSGVGITGSYYRPLDVDFQIKEQFEKMIQVIHQKESFYEKALIAILGISYLQPFEDGNKRTARLFANALLLIGGCAPLSYRSVDEAQYRESLLVFYEKNSIKYFKEIFMEQYVFACENYSINV